MFAKDVSTTAFYDVAKVIGVDVPLHIKTDLQEVTVNPGDYIVADIDGVVIIPPSLVDQVADLALRQKAADAKMHEAISQGMTFIEAGKQFRG